MASGTKVKDDLLRQFEMLFHAGMQNSLSPIQRTIREKGWDRFLELGLPTKKQRGYHYFPLLALHKESFEPHSEPLLESGQIEPYILPECRRSYVVFINGKYSPEFSDTSGLDSRVVVLPLKDALNVYGHFLQGRLSKTLQEELDPFATLNLALVERGLFLYVPPHLQVDKPLQCIHILSNDRPNVFSPRTQMFLGKGSFLELNCQYHCLKDNDYLINSVVDVVLEEEARLTCCGTVTPRPNGYCFEAVRVTQKRNSHFHSVQLTAGTKGVRTDYRVSLLEEGATCDLKGIALLSSTNQSHTNIWVEHNAPHCTSNQLFKNVLLGTSRASFEGKIFIHPEAQQTMAYQLNQNLLLSDKAMVNSRPNLEIFADDVKASHGATVTRLNPEHLFYLKSRGIFGSAAQQLLLKGFIQQMIEQTPCLFTKEKMQQIAEGFTSGS